MSRPRQGGVRFHRTTGNGMQLKTYEFFFSGIFYLIFLDHDLPRVIETTESETADNGGSAVLCTVKTNHIAFHQDFPMKVIFVFLFFIQK